MERKIPRYLAILTFKNQEKFLWALNFQLRGKGFVFLFFCFKIYLFLRDGVSWEGAEKEGDGESEAGSVLTTASQIWG